MRQKEQISTYLKNTFSDACSRDSVQHRWKNDSISPKSRVEPLAFNIRTSPCKFYTLFSENFPWCWQGQFV